MDEALGVNIQELLEALARNGVPLPYEIGTFIALSACEALIDRPAVLAQQNVWVRDDGEVSVTATGTASEEEGARSVITLLGSLLVKSAPGVPPMLLSLVESGTGDGRWEIAPLRDALEATLVPLNRAATQRVLARILREAGGPGRGLAEPQPDERAVAGKLDAILGVDSAQADRFRAAPPTRVVEELVPEGDGGAQDRGPAGLGAPDDGPVQSPLSAQSRERDVERIRESPGSGRMVWLAVALFVLVAGGIAFFVARPSGPEPAPDRATGQAPEEPRGPAPSRSAFITSEPGGAQVLLRVGRGGGPIGGFAIGVAHELVVLQDEASQAVRVLVPADADWGDAKRLTVSPPEPGVAKDSGLLPVAGVDLGPTRLGAELGQNSGQVGTVTVDAPPGAQVFKLVGFTPDARLEGLPSQGPAELLVYRRGFRLERLTVASEALAVRPDGQALQLAVTLAAR